MATFLLPQNTGWSQVGGDMKGVGTPTTPAPPYNDTKQGYLQTVQQGVYMQTPNGLVLVQNANNPIVKVPDMQQFPSPPQVQQVHQMGQVSHVGFQGQSDSDNAYSKEAITRAYSLYSTISVKKGAIVCPQELQCRGLTQASLENAIARVQSVKSSSDTNKIILHTGMFLVIGLLGNLFVSMHWVGNKPLRNQLSPVLEQVNIQMGQQGVPVRFAWVDGALRAYYK